MKVGIIPIRNEGDTIEKVLAQLQFLALDEILVILNGCTDDSLQKVLQFPDFRIKPILYPFPLGIDVPRAVGVRYAKKNSSDLALFVDGDCTGEIHWVLQRLMEDVEKNKVDLALTNCYPYPDYRGERAKMVLRARENLNRSLGKFHQLGLANPSHGPHCISKKGLEHLPLQAFAIPPFELALCAQKGYLIHVSATLRTHQWHSKERGEWHNQKIAETIIGDCKMAQNYIEKGELNREGWIGYHKKRRMDVLNSK